MNIIINYYSLNIIVDNLLSLLDGTDIDYVDDGILRQSFENYMINSQYKSNAERAHESILSDYDNVSDLLNFIKE
ncbi:hypothetical protein [uncultured Methanobrevibacter sp.]|uniref:hypothetical protein n=1 Tax=uncultured Methanobrevibacter sp. TaxID=253161 RepID=UPI0025DB4162|nr:hypothetical protein [uncultured Methanobrevibacter sp.]